MFSIVRSVSSVSDVSIVCNSKKKKEKKDTILVQVDRSYIHSYFNFSTTATKVTVTKERPQLPNGQLIND